MHVIHCNNIRSYDNFFSSSSSCSTWKIRRMNYGAQFLLSFYQLIVLVSADFMCLVFQSQSVGSKCNTWSDPHRGSLFEHEIILSKVFDRESMLLRSLSISIRLFNTIVDNSPNEYLKSKWRSPSNSCLTYCTKLWAQSISSRIFLIKVRQ